MVYSKNKQRLYSLQTHGTPLAGGGETYDSNCCIYGGLDLTGYSWIMQVCSDVNKMYGDIISLTHAVHRVQLRTREELRERYGIRGAPFGDCLSSWCCRPCALTQERREIELEESSF